MIQRAHVALGVALVLMGGMAVFLTKLQSMQRISPPGVRLVARTIIGEGGKVIGTNTVDLPERVLHYESKEVPMPDEVVDWLPKDTTLAQRHYTATNSPSILMNTVVMGMDRTSIHRPEYCLRGQGFNVEKTEPAEVAVSKPHAYSLPVMKLTCSKEGTLPDGTRALQRGLFIYWFVSENQITADHHERIKWMTRDLVFRRTLQRWAYVSCFAVCQPGQEEALFARMHDFIGAAAPEFQLVAGPAAAELRRMPEGR